ncbi:Tim44/TimA family putative adaptor protein [Parvularcula maris]|uniref:Tim44/TimA family putative adaptor protein n=1 Tax=Parvularcula maris TaxID=2965077 RepID=A0A9X2L6S6_9PROT|nr:Tim44/TimA family putative adaptor protein [Parvularcula maris]MCQ8184001.1 Tim44/TimA family putative adaptor protein [Parvularcula maris]
MDLSLIIFAALALFLSYRLFNVLGTRGGHEPDEADRPILRPVPTADEIEANAAPAQSNLTPVEKLPLWAKEAREHVADFEPKPFLEGAKAAYEMVVEAYASGDLGDVRGFVAPDVIHSFEVAIDGRQQAGQKVDFTFVGAEQPEVMTVVRESEHLSAEVRFRSEQVRAVRNEAGEVVEGNPEQVVTVVDTWTFTRPIDTNDPNWTLVATSAA